MTFLAIFHVWLSNSRRTAWDLQSLLSDRVLLLEGDLSFVGKGEQQRFHSFARFALLDSALCVRACLASSLASYGVRVSVCVRPTPLV